MCSGASSFNGMRNALLWNLKTSCILTCPVPDLSSSRAFPFFVLLDTGQRPCGRSAEDSRIVFGVPHWTVLWFSVLGQACI